jgi:hypothetical protein
LLCYAFHPRRTLLAVMCVNRREAIRILTLGERDVSRETMKKLRTKPKFRTMRFEVAIFLCK